MFNCNSSCFVCLEKSKFFAICLYQSWWHLKVNYLEVTASPPTASHYMTRIFKISVRSLGVGLNTMTYFLFMCRHSFSSWFAFFYLFLGHYSQFSIYGRVVQWVMVLHLGLEYFGSNEPRYEDRGDVWVKFATKWAINSR